MAHATLDQKYVAKALEEAESSGNPVTNLSRVVQS